MGLTVALWQSMERLGVLEIFRLHGDPGQVALGGVRAGRPRSGLGFPPRAA